MVPIQMIHVHYQEKYLNLLDSDDHTPLYRVRVSREVPQMQMVHLQPSSGEMARRSSASFKMTSFEVTLAIDGTKIRLERHSLWSRTYRFQSRETQSMLMWESDGAVTGDFQLVDPGSQVLCRFRNKLFSTSEVGSFEIVGEMSDALKEEILISGLAVLAMVQSLSLAAMVTIG
ncbi:hypothetical protein BDW42DRAFT_15557 [Aspergillus taichungensis]|uniref:Tubby C-terminal-like domain-containing protein n=1 Tax=Aspergillus taichungensis TaxID=482145 RepID=A0A2J5HI78_9EURO|nr:hypothetical protein BDW42DRAFT_15557 [Aspergillus taichungensis]